MVEGVEVVEVVEVVEEVGFGVSEEEEEAEGEGEGKAAVGFVSVVALFKIELFLSETKDFNWFLYSSAALDSYLSLNLVSELMPCWAKKEAAAAFPPTSMSLT